MNPTPATAAIAAPDQRVQRPYPRSLDPGNPTGPRPTHPGAPHLPEEGGVRNPPSQHFIGSALTVTFWATTAALAPARATAAELSADLWQNRPLLVFAPSESDLRLVATMRRIDASQCDFGERDMVLGRIVTEGASTLDGEAVDTDQPRQLLSEFGIGANGFSVVLIGKDGGEKLCVNVIPDLQAIYAVIDGMPMRGREMRADPGRC